MMDVQMKSSNGFSCVPLETRLLTERQVYIEGEITPEAANEFYKKILFLNMEDSEKPIDVLINSEGGEILSGLLMYDVIQTSPAPIRTICKGRGSSMAAVLFASGTNGRYMLPHSELMIHEPLLGNRVGGSASSIKSVSESLLEAKHKMDRILAKHSGKTLEEIEKATAYDHYMTPEEAMEFGLCDAIIDFGKTLENLI